MKTSATVDWYRATIDHNGVTLHTRHRVGDTDKWVRIAWFNDPVTADQFLRGYGETAFQALLLAEESHKAKLEAR